MPDVAIRVLGSGDEGILSRLVVAMAEGVVVGMVSGVHGATLQLRA